MEKPNNISCDEAFFFFDSLFKGLFKIVLKKGENEIKPSNRRIAYDDLKKIISGIFGNQKFLLRDEFYENIQKNSVLNGFLEKMHEDLQNSLVYAR